MKKLYETIAKLLTFWIPISSVRRNLRNKIIHLFENIEIQKIQKNYPKILKKIQLKVQQGKKINVGFFVIYDSVFPAEPLFKKMLEDDLFNPFIVVIPDTSRGEENMFYQMNKTYNTLSKKYKNIYKSYNEKTKKFVEFNMQFDIVNFANPYDHMTNKLYSIKYNVKQKILPIYINYGTMPDYYARNHIINLMALNICWKVYIDTKDNLEDVKQYTNFKGKNAVLSGYCKMDNLNSIEKKQLLRKKIIIAPHHTVNMINFPLSNFLTYCDLFLELPQKYPQIDFVFRPHPLLFVTLAKENLWGKEKVNEYINKITSFKNVEYQEGGDYFETFINSSAIIHDCSSFIMEYLYTGHPACYMLKDQNEIKDIFAPIGQKCLENYYKVFNEEEIYKFIDDVVLNGNDYMKEKRIRFAQKEIMLNYPNVSTFIINNLKENLL